ncbi:MAG TPA: hypothetical protein VIF15_14050 [Polyangiaceae bacterium]
MKTLRARIELATPLGVGILLGLATGILLGMVAGGMGALVGLAAGAGAGFLAGTAMHRDEGRRAARARELDAIIGVAGGDLGAAPVSIPPPADEAPSTQWMAEWLTPPPPVAG